MTTRAVFIDELKAIVKTDKQKWQDKAFERAVNAALRLLSWDKPIKVDAELQLTAGQRKYPLPEDCLSFTGTQWGEWPQLEAYDTRWPGVLPRIYTENSPTGKMLTFSTAPSGKYLAAYGSTLRYEYNILHQLTDEICTVFDEHQDLLYLAALANLIQDLVASNVTTPVQLHRGIGNMGSMPNNSTPLVAHQYLVNRYKELLV